MYNKIEPNRFRSSCHTGNVVSLPLIYLTHMPDSYLDAAKGYPGKGETKTDVEKLEDDLLPNTDGCVLDSDYDLSYALALSLQDEEYIRQMALREEELAISAKRGQNQGNVKVYRPGDDVRWNSLVSDSLIVT